MSSSVYLAQHVARSVRSVKQLGRTVDECAVDYATSEQYYRDTFFEVPYAMAGTTRMRFAHVWVERRHLSCGFLCSDQKFAVYPRDGFLYTARHIGEWR